MDSNRPAALAVCRNSHSVPNPKIRVVHVFAPEIIKTDPSNFRELVQRLTGKPSMRTQDAGKKRRRKKKVEAVARLAPTGAADVMGNSDESSSFLSGLGEEGDEFFRGLAGDLPLLPLMMFSGRKNNGEA